jgi:hypothetical protein
MTSVSLLGRMDADAAALRLRVETLTRQVSTGQKTGQLGDLAPQLPRALTLSAEIARRGTYGTAIATALGQASATQTALQQLGAIARNFGMGWTDDNGAIRRLLGRGFNLGRNLLKLLGGLERCRFLGVVRGILGVLTEDFSGLDWVGLVLELECATVVQVNGELDGQVSALDLNGNGHLLLHDLLVLFHLVVRSHALPRQVSLYQINQNVADRLEIVPSTLLYAQMSVN